MATFYFHTRNTQKAFSLLELVIFLAISSALIHFSIIPFTNLINSEQEKTVIRNMLSAINYARNTARTSQKHITICSGHKTCVTQKLWKKNFIVFSDKNQNGQRESNEAILRYFSVNTRFSWYWNNFRKLNYLSFNEKGITNSSNGSFLLCKNRLTKNRIVINKAGRARFESTSKGKSCIK